MLVQGLGEYLTSDEAFVRSKGKLTDSLLVAGSATVLFHSYLI